MTVGYLAVGSFYFGIPIKEYWSDVIVYSIILFISGLSLWFAIQYMDAGVRNVSEIIITHVLAASIITAILSLSSRWLVVKVLNTIPQETAEVLALPKTLFGYITYALLLLNFYLFKYRDNLLKREEAEEKLKGLLHEAELNLLKSQLNPHFIFNSLNSISALTISSPEKSREMIARLSSFLRYSLGKDKTDLVPLKEELENLKLFVDIEKTRFGNRLKIMEEFNDVCLNVQIPIMILQPIIENAIKFSTYDTVDDITIYLKCKQRGEGVLISVKNPFDPFETSSKGKGIGLKNVRQRLNLFYGRKSELITETDNEYFVVRMFIPFS